MTVDDDGGRACRRDFVTAILADMANEGFAMSAETMDVLRRWVAGDVTDTQTIRDALKTWRARVKSG